MGRKSRVFKKKEKRGSSANPFAVKKPTKRAEKRSKTTQRSINLEAIDNDFSSLLQYSQRPLSESGVKTCTNTSKLVSLATDHRNGDLILKSVDLCSPVSTFSINDIIEWTEKTGISPES